MRSDDKNRRLTIPVVQYYDFSSDITDSGRECRFLPKEILIVLVCDIKERFGKSQPITCNKHRTYENENSILLTEIDSSASEK